MSGINLASPASEANHATIARLLIFLVSSMTIE
jgi:hypothetical protein